MAGGFYAVVYATAWAPLQRYFLGHPVAVAATILFCIAGKWVAFQKFGRPGWKSAIPIYNAVTILEMAGWDGQYALAFVFFPWVRKAVMHNVADRWGMDKGSFGLGLTAFPFFYWPMLGWGKAMHSECYVPKEWALPGKVSRKKQSDDDED